MAKEKYLADFRPMMERCSNCLACKWIPYDKIRSRRFGENCPASLYYKFFTYSARGKMQAAQALEDGEYGYTDAMYKAAVSCMACGSCDVSCKVSRYNLEPLDFNLALKNDAVSKGRVLPGQQRMLDSLQAEQTMISGCKKADRKKWAEGLDLADITKEKADLLFFPGCKYSYGEGLMETARNAVRLLCAAGVRVGYLGDADVCCAGRAYQQGFFDAFDARAGANLKLFKKLGVKIIVTPCSDCCHAFKRLYAEKGFEAEVLHIVEYLDRLMAEGKLRFTKALGKTVTYHDPCHLGRLGEPFVPWDGQEKKIMNQVHTWEPRRPRYNGAYGVYDAPRNVLEAIPGLKLAEMERIREYSLCCGAGAGGPENVPELSKWTASERVTEANATGAELLVTACPWCKANFTDTADENGKTIQVMDIVDLAYLAI